MVRDVEVGTLYPKFKTKRAPTCLGNFLGNCNYRIGVIPIKAGVFSANSMVIGPTNSHRALSVNGVADKKMFKNRRLRWRH
jgi:hypothetical protein